MLYLTILILLNIFLYLRLKRILDQSLIRVEDNFQEIKDKQTRLVLTNKKIKEENLSLQNTNEETLALYDITKQICRSLEEDKVFSDFNGQMHKYIRVEDCKFLKSKADLSQYNNYTIFPLVVKKHIVRYLLAKGLRQEERDKFQILAQQFLLGVKRALLYQQVHRLSITDSLTGVFSRRYWWERFNAEIRRSRRFRHHLACLIVDIDHFKDYNDRYGHLVGDTILREVAKTLKANIRQIDFIGRFGGDEFTVILTETDNQGARFAAERIRQSIKDERIRVYDEDLSARVSIGISVFPNNGCSASVLIEQADEALYQAKHTGRNRVCEA